MYKKFSLFLYLAVLSCVFQSTVEGLPLPDEENPIFRREPMRPTGGRTMFNSFANEMTGGFPNIIETLTPMEVVDDTVKTGRSDINLDDLTKFVSHAADLREEVAIIDPNKQRARQFQEGLDSLINPYLTVGAGAQQVQEPAFEVIWVEK